MSKHLTQISFVLSETALVSPLATALSPDCPSLSIWQAVCQTQKKYLVDQSGSLVWPKGFYVPCPLLTPWISSYYNPSSPSSHHAFRSIDSPSLELAFHSSQVTPSHPSNLSLKSSWKGLPCYPTQGKSSFHAGSQHLVYFLPSTSDSFWLGQLLVFVYCLLLLWDALHIEGSQYPSAIWWIYNEMILQVEWPLNSTLWPAVGLPTDPVH